MAKYLQEKKHINLLICLCWLAYSVATFARLSYSSSIVDVVADFGVSNESAGLVASAFSLFYGIGQLINGLTVGRIKPQNMIFGGLLASAVLTLSLRILPFEYYKYVWGLNGLVQSVLWCNIVQTFADSLPDKSMPKAILIIGFTTVTGTFVAYAVSALCSALNNWKAVFTASFVAVIATAVLWKITLAKLTSVRSQCPDVEAKSADEGGRNNGWIKLLGVATGVLVLTALGNNFTKNVYADWSPKVIVSAFGVTSATAKLITMFMPAVALLGSVLAKRLFKLMGNPFSLIGLLYFATALVLVALRFFYDANIVLTTVLFAMIALLITAINVTHTAIIPLNLRGHGTPGRITGLINCFCHLGEAIAGVALGGISDVHGWTGVFTTVGVVCFALVAAAVVGAIRWKKTVAPQIE